MLWRSSTLIGSGIRATDGAIGSIADLLFEDDSWQVRWVVVDTGSWLSGRKVLLPAGQFGQVQGTPPEFPVDLTRRQVEESPETGFDAPVSRHLENRIYGYYGWTPYWNLAYAPPPFGAPMPGPAAAAPPPLAEPSPAQTAPKQPSGDPHLRSAREVTGYYVHATDGDIGHVEEFLVEDEAWAIRYVVVDTRNWWPGRKVLVSPRWFREIDWTAQKVHVDHSRDQVRGSPEYDPSVPPRRGEEAALHAHYGVPPYWI